MMTSGAFLKIIMRLVVSTIAIVILGSPGNIWASAPPIATLQKIAGKIVPPRQPITKPRLVTTALPIPMINRYKTEKRSISSLKGTMRNSPEKSILTLINVLNAKIRPKIPPCQILLIRSLIKMANQFSK